MTDIVLEPLSAQEVAPTHQTFQIWRAGLWCGAACASLAGFLPPPHQTWGAERVAEFFSHGRVLVGIVGWTFVAPFWAVMSTVISRIMARIEGRDGILHRIEFYGGIATTGAAMLAGIPWMVAAYQPENRPVDIIKAFSDLGWFFFNMTVMVSFVQYLSFGLCVVLDKREKPYFPSWVGWLSFMACGSFVPIVLMPFFPNSPFAWDGLMTYWVALTLFFTWVPCVLTLAFRAVRRIETETLTAAPATA